MRSKRRITRKYPDILRRKRRGVDVEDVTVVVLVSDVTVVEGNVGDRTTTSLVFVVVCEVVEVV
jgi:hypothetical protein